MKHFAKMLLTSAVTAFLVSLSSASLAGSESTFPLTGATYPTVQKAVANRDILGVKLGMTAREVAQVMASEGYVVEKKETRVTATVNNQKVNSEPFVKAIFGKHADGSFMSAYFTSPLNGNGAYAIKRNIEYNNQAGPSISDVTSSLSQKYKIAYGAKNNYEDCMMSGNVRYEMFGRSIPKSETFEIIRGTLDDSSRPPIDYCFSAGFEGKSGRATAVAVALIDGRAYVKDKAELQQAVKSFEQGNLPKTAAPKL